MRIIRERKFEPIKIHIDSPEDLTYILNVFKLAFRQESRSWGHGQSEICQKINADLKVIEGYHFN